MSVNCLLVMFLVVWVGGELKVFLVGELWLRYNDSLI